MLFAVKQNGECVCVEEEMIRESYIYVRFHLHNSLSFFVAYAIYTIF